jgi:hypothetical protein
VSRRVLIVETEEPVEGIIAKFREMIDALELSLVESATGWVQRREGRMDYHIWAPGVVNFNIDIKYQPIAQLLFMLYENLRTCASGTRIAETQ